jgi:isoquinoline 1-oxidoreductase alpha subunit
MSATALLASTPEPTDADIDRAMSGNICRCGTYVAIRKAIHRAAEIQAERPTPGPVVHTDLDGEGEGP